jgi:transcription elongation GreA/GreB family factor
MDIISPRATLLQACNQFVHSRITSLEKAIADAQASAAGETKSSMGDKYETSRAMAQQEADNSRSQLSDALALKSVLDKCPLQSPGHQVVLGSVVYTNQQYYFIAIPAGAIQVVDQTFLAISRISPIGKLLMGKCAGDKISWQGNTITIQSVE